MLSLRKIIIKNFVLPGAICVLGSTNLSAAETPAGAEPAADTSDDSTMEWLIEKRHDWSDRFHSMAASIDEYFAGEDSLGLENKSYVRLRLGARWEEGERVGEDTDLKVRIDLPITKKRWKLFIENQLDEFEDFDSRNRADLIRPESRDDSFYGGISGEKETENWQLRPELGVKLRFPVDLFTRFRATRPIEIEGPWEGQFRQSVYYFHQEGFGARSRLSFQRPWGDQFLWRTSSEAEWQDEGEEFNLAQVFGLNHILNEDQALAYEVGLLGERDPSLKLSSYYANVRFRQRLHEDWLFFDVIPGVSWPRDKDFDSVVSLTARVEILFSKGL